MMFKTHSVSRRRLLIKTFAGTCMLASAEAAFMCTAAALENQSRVMRPTHLINALKITGKPICVNEANRLATSTTLSEGFDLHLRQADLNNSDARILANGMRRSEAENALYIRSFSASYNAELGDNGAQILVEAIPESISELGLVGCTIGDSGGRAILSWARVAPRLRVICLEQNRFSADLRSQFRELAAQRQQILVVV